MPFHSAVTSTLMRLPAFAADDLHSEQSTCLALGHDLDAD